MYPKYLKYKQKYLDLKHESFKSLHGGTHQASSNRYYNVQYRDDLQCDIHAKDGTRRFINTVGHKFHTLEHITIDEYDRLLHFLKTKPFVLVNYNDNSRKADEKVYTFTKVSPGIRQYGIKLLCKTGNNKKELTLSIQDYHDNFTCMLFDSDGSSVVPWFVQSTEHSQSSSSSVPTSADATHQCPKNIFSFSCNNIHTLESFGNFDNNEFMKTLYTKIYTNNEDKYINMVHNKLILQRFPKLIYKQNPLFKIHVAISLPFNDRKSHVTIMQFYTTPRIFKLLDQNNLKNKLKEYLNNLLDFKNLQLGIIGKNNQHLAYKIGKIPFDVTELRSHIYNSIKPLLYINKFVINSDTTTKIVEQNYNYKTYMAVPSIYHGKGNLLAHMTIGSVETERKKNTEFEYNIPSLSVNKSAIEIDVTKTIFYSENHGVSFRYLNSNERPDGTPSDFTLAMNNL